MMGPYVNPSDFERWRIFSNYHDHERVGNGPFGENLGSIITQGGKKVTARNLHDGGRGLARQTRQDVKFADVSDQHVRPIGVYRGCGQEHACRS